MTAKIISQQPDESATIADGDLFTVVDISDTSLATTGTNKKLTWVLLLAQAALGLPYDHTVSGLAATTIKTAIDELASGTEIADLPVAAQLDGTEIIPGFQGAGGVGIKASQLVTGPVGEKIGPEGTRYRGYEDMENAVAFDATTTPAAPGLIPGSKLQLEVSGTGAGTLAQQWAGEVFSGFTIIGVLGLSTGTTTTGATQLHPQLAYPWNTADTIKFIARLRVPILSDGTNTFKVRAGFTKDATVSAPTDGIYFESSTNWRAINRGSSTSTDGDTGVAVSTGHYVNLGIITDGSTVHFFLSSDQSPMVEVVTQSTNRPANGIGLVPFISIVKTAGTSVRTVNVDALGWDLPFNRGLSLDI